MSSTRFIGIVGHKKSGKTTLIEHLAKEMTSWGLIIGTIKNTSHDLEFDTPGKDTHRHRAAGADVALIKSKSQIALYSDSNFIDDEIIEAIFHKCDFVFVEGDSGSKYPKVCVVDEGGMRENITGEIIAIWGTRAISNFKYFDKGQIKELCDFLINRR